MGKQTLIMILGVWVAIQSFLGLPLAFDRVVFALLGIAILGLGILLRHDALTREKHEGQDGAPASTNSSSDIEHSAVDEYEGKRE